MRIMDEADGQADGQDVALQTNTEASLTVRDDSQMFMLSQ